MSPSKNRASDLGRLTLHSLEQVAVPANAQSGAAATLVVADQAPTPSVGAVVETSQDAASQGLAGAVPEHISLSNIAVPSGIAAEPAHAPLHWLRRAGTPFKLAYAGGRLLVVLLCLCALSASVVGFAMTHATRKQAVVTSKPAVSAPKTNTTTPAPQPTQPTVSAPAPTPNPSPAPVPAVQATPAPAPPPAMPAVTGKDTSYNLGVLVIKYFPLTSNGQNINISVTGDVGDPYSMIRQRTIDITNNLLTYIPKATQYLGYAYGGNKPAISLHVVATFEHTTAVPINATLHPGFVTYPDYYGIMSSHNICSYVDGQGVHEVFLWAYQGPNQPSKNNQPYLGIEESKMSGPHGDISNSYEWNDMPVCKHTYVVYTFNYGRGTAEALHSWGHQIEAEMKVVDPTLFGLFQGSAHPQTSGVTGRCGSVHNPPNARQEYDYANPVP